MKTGLFCGFLLLAASTTIASGQTVSVPQLDRGAGSYVRQFPTPAAVNIPQLPASARPIPPRPATTRIVQEPVPEHFLAAAEPTLPQGWSEVSDSEPISERASDASAPPSVGAGVTVILTPREQADLPSVGPGAVANTDSRRDQ
jgi:hypothetical protein